LQKQHILIKYWKIFKFHSVYGFLEGLRRSKSIFLELDLFDFCRGVNTRTIKVASMDKETYMYYVAAFTSVVREMIRFSHNYYLSAIRYSDFERKTIFIDFGAGMGKTVIIAGETGKFELVGGLEIDPELVEYARKI
jgi:hypothetical protein